MQYYWLEDRFWTICWEKTFINKKQICTVTVIGWSLASWKSVFQYWPNLTIYYLPCFILLLQISKQKTQVLNLEKFSGTSVEIGKNQATLLELDNQRTWKDDISCLWSRTDMNREPNKFLETIFSPNISLGKRAYQQQLNQINRHTHFPLVFP